VCTKCKIEKDLNKFYKDRSKVKDGKQSQCKYCADTTRDRAKLKISKAIYYINNKQKLIKKPQIIVVIIKKK